MGSATKTSGQMKAGRPKGNWANPERDAQMAEEYRRDPFLGLAGVGILHNISKQRVHQIFKRFPGVSQKVKGHPPPDRCDVCSGILRLHQQNELATMGQVQEVVHLRWRQTVNQHVRVLREHNLLKPWFCWFRSEKKALAIELFKNNPTITIREIGERLGINKGALDVHIVRVRKHFPELVPRRR